jgi:nuclear pore complex protein Nup160
MFLRRLLQPGVNHCSALRDTLLEYKRFLSDSEFQALTSNGLRKEMLSIIEQEVLFFCFVVSFCSFRLSNSCLSI